MTTIRVTGRVDPLDAAELRQRIDAALSGPSLGAHVDLSEVTHLHLAGVAAITAGQSAAHRSGRRLTVSLPVSPQARAQFEVTGTLELVRQR